MAEFKIREEAAFVTCEKPAHGYHHGNKQAKSSKGGQGYEGECSTAIHLTLVAAAIYMIVEMRHIRAQATEWSREAIKAVAWPRASNTWRSHR